MRFFYAAIQGKTHMKQQSIQIEHIPALLWGESSDRVVLAVHGSGSHKADVPVSTLAEIAAAHGWQVLSFDLPEHGDRRADSAQCIPQVCVPEIQTVFRALTGRWEHIRLFANSLGAYFSLLALAEQPVGRAWFLSPVVDMRRLIENMMRWFGVSEERLRAEGQIETPIGQTLRWDYYRYVCGHPIDRWDIPTDILYGERDEMCERDTVEAFAGRFGAGLTIVPGSEHYFHTPEQIAALRGWLERAWDT